MRVSIKNIPRISILIFLFFLHQNIAHSQSEWEKVTSVNSTHIQVLEPTPIGILAGEFDTRVTLVPAPFNGVYFSKNLGRTWVPIGLEKRGVMDIKYFNGKIYATTYYVINNTNGLFYSTDMGNTWNNIGPGYSPTKVDRDIKTIYLGTEHYGLFISEDEGQTWERKITEAGSNWKVYEIQSSDEITLVSKSDRVFKSFDNGESWEEIEQLYNKGITSFCINNNIIFAGSSGTSGLYLSRDLGENWEKVASFGNFPVGKISEYKGKYFAGRYNPEKDLYTVYYSSNIGNSWIDTNLDTYENDKSASITALFSEPAYLLASLTNQGIYKYPIPKDTFLKNQFLKIPWNYSNTSELLDNITSYFDHSYPLLGYIYFNEPEGESESTTNYLGYKNSIPNIYYSNHSGTDFGLKYGTYIKAPASGYATYYYCKDCGNSIKIDHQNGYQTTYMHLQEDGIITKNNQVWVNNDDIIGKVGLTGHTTGPHLHFEVLKDSDLSGSYSNDFPAGRVDPFGWQSNDKTDPWENFSWEDTLGNHNGTKSYYLWNIENDSISEPISNETYPTEDSIITYRNKSIFFQNVQNLFTAKVTPYIQPILDLSEGYLQYVKNSSFIVEAFNQLGENINSFDEDLTIEIDIEPSNLLNIDLQSIDLRFWDKITNKWVSLPSIFDLENLKLTSSTNHLTWFAVFGNKIDTEPPSTEILVSGSQEDIWYTEPPVINLSTSGSDSNKDTIIYSINDGDEWINYYQPFTLNDNGVINLLYKSIDENENIENENSYVININAQHSPTKKIKITNSVFQAE